MKKIAFLVALLALPVQADLLQQIQSVTGWVGYGVPIADGDSLICSWGDGSWSHWNELRGRSSSALYLFYEVREGEILTIRLSSPECPPNKTDRWLADVDPKESARMLRGLIDRNTSISKKAVAAFALHRGTTDELITIAKRHPSSKVRSQSLFWLSQQAGDKAIATLRGAVDNDPDAEVKEKAVFGISQLPNDRSVPLLIELMRSHRSPNVRKKAAFWLGQKDDPRALAAIEEILTR
jgi:hypothetical protein